MTDKVTRSHVSLGPVEHRELRSTSIIVELRYYSSADLRMLRRVEYNRSRSDNRS